MSEALQMLHGSQLQLLRQQVMAIDRISAA
jgi:hypothetical protein